MIVFAHYPALEALGYNTSPLPGLFILQGANKIERHLDSKANILQTTYGTHGTPGQAE